MKTKKWIMVSALTAVQFFLLAQSGLFMTMPFLPLILCVTIGLFIGLGLKEGIKSIVLLSLFPLLILVAMREFVFAAIFLFVVAYSLLNILWITAGRTAGMVHFYGGVTIFLILAGLTYYYDLPVQWTQLPWVEDVLANVGAINGTLDVSKQIDIRALEKTLRAFSEGVALLFPSIIILFSGIFSGFSYYWGISFATKLQAEKPIFKEVFSEFELPSNIFRGILIVGLVAVVMKGMNWKYDDVLFYNVIYLSTSAFLWLGVSVIDFFLKRKGMRTGLRVALILLMFILPISVTLFPAIGCAEQLLHIRQRLKKSA